MLSAEERSPLRAGLQLAKFVFAAQSHGEIVLLDLATDKYYGLDSDASRALVDALRGIVPNPTVSGRTLETISWLRSKGLVEPFDNVTSSEPRNFVSVAAEPGGLSTLDVTGYKLRGTARPGLRLVLQAFLMLARVDRIASRKSISGVVRAIHLAQSIVPRPATTLSKQDTNIARILEASAQAILLYPRRVDCLVRAAALTLLLLKNGIHATAFVVGVQKYPFYAHAWVEHDESVLGDSEEVRRRLAPLVRVARDRTERCAL